VVPTLQDGTDPSVVYFIVAPLVTVLMATFCPDEYVLGAGLKAGIAAAERFILYEAVATPELVIPVLQAMALMVLVVDTAKGLV